MFRLSQNHRNTKQIAAFASQLLANMDLTDDGTMPNLESCDRNGPAPTILVGTFSQQMAYVIDYIKRFVDLRTDSVAFLHPLGGGWFRYVRNSLGSAGLEWADIAREVDWPVGSENIALSTLHSAKGLEFDHVIMLGLNEEVLPQQSEGDDGGFETLQRLFAMAIGRAKTTLILGYKRGEAPSILSLAQKGTYVSVNL